jgi:hypothetical protein
MADEAGFEVASAYVTLRVDDEGFAAEVQAAIEEAVGGAADEAGSTLAERLQAGMREGGESGGEALTSALASAAAEGGEEVTGTLVEALVGAGHEAGEGFAEALQEATGSAGSVIAEELADEIAIGLMEVPAATAEQWAALSDLFAPVGDEYASSLVAALSERLSQGAPAALDELAEQMLSEAEVDGESSGDAFVRAFTEQVTTGIAEFGSLSDNVLLASSFGGLGEQAGEEFAAQYSAQVEEALNKVEIATTQVELTPSGMGIGGGSPTAPGGGSGQSGGGGIAGILGTLLGVEGMGDLAGGPATMLMWQAPWLLKQLPSMLDGSSSAAELATALSSAVASDQGQAGSNTASTVTKAIQGGSWFNTLESQTGLSQLTLIESAMGDSSAQSLVNATLSTQQTAANQTDTQDTSGGRAGVLGQPNAGSVQGTQLAAAQQALNQLTASTASAVSQQTQLQQAMLAVNQTTDVMNANLHAAWVNMETNAQQTGITNTALLNLGGGMDAENAQLIRVSASYAESQQQASAYASTLDAMNNTSGATVGSLNNDAEYMAIFNRVLADNVQASDLSAQHSAQQSVALLNLGTSQSQLNFQLVQAETAYGEAQSGANAYTAALNAQSGSASGLLSTQAAETLALNSFTTALAQNGTSLDANTVAGAENIQAAQGVAAAADQQAAALYQSEVGTKGATQAYQDANTLLQQEEQAFINAAEKAGANTQQVQALAQQLYQLPPAIQAASGTVDVNTSNAQANVQALATSLAAVTLQISTLQLSGEGAQIARSNTPRAYASGGPVQGGVPIIVGDGGRPEMFVPKSDGDIYPSVDEGMDAIGGSGRPAGGVTLQYFGSQLPTAEEHAQMMRDLATVGAI